MPLMKNGKRDYKEEYKRYGAGKKDKVNRAARNKNRARAERAGKVHKGDGKDVSHKKAMHNGGGNGKGNLKVQSKSKNRSHHINKATKGSQRPKRSTRSK